MRTWNRVLCLGAVLLLLGACSNADPVVRFADDALSVPESAGTVTVTAVINPASASDVAIPLEIGGTAAEDDRLFSTRVLRIPGGATSASFQIAIVNDTVPESSETVIVTMNPPGGVDRGDPQTFTLTIVNDDSIPPPTVRFTAQSQSAAEGAGTVTAVVQLSAASASAVTVPYTLSGTSDAADRSVTPSSPLTIPAGQTSATISIAITSDSANEPDETLVIALGTPTGATLGTPSTHTLTITDDDATPGTPAVSFAAASSSAGENAGTLNIVVQVSPTSTSDITVPFTVGGTATAPGDFSASASPLVIPAGAASANIVVTLVDDAAVEPTETIVLTLGAPTGGGSTLGAQATHTLSVTDNDTPAAPVVSFASAASNPAENAGAVALTVQLSQTSTSDISVPFTLGGSASTPADFAASPSPLVIPAGASSANITLSLVDDAVSDPAETIVVTLGAPSGGGATLGAQSTHTATIGDNEPAPVVRFAAAASNRTEADGAVDIAVQVSPVSSSDISVSFAVGGDATAPDDFSSSPSPLVISAGSAGANIVITLVDDTTIESAETVQLTLAAPSGGGSVLGIPAVHTMSIADNEPPGVVVSGKVTFDRVPHDPATDGLSYPQVRQDPARGVTVQAIDSGSQAVLATTTTDDAGSYSLAVPQNTLILVRVRAEMLRTGPAPNWNFTVVDNTNGNALYTLASADFNSGTANLARDLNAASGFNSAGNETGTRAAAPFAILDSMFDAFNKVLGADATAQFAPLRAGWSRNNVPSSSGAANDQACDSTGNIGTSFYTSGETCLLGAANSDTDEYDGHVVIHEWGHYFEDKFSRSDSVGGPHGSGDRLDMRVAFGEGWGNAWSGIATDDPIYRDSNGGQQAQGFRIDVESNAVTAPAGWFNEESQQSILYDLYDAAPDGADNLALGFGPLYQILVNQQRTGVPLTSVFSFVTALRAANPASGAGIDALVNGQNIRANGMDAFGSTETNNGGSADALPLYTQATVNAAGVNVCSNPGFGLFNKLGVRSFIRFTVTTPGDHTFSATGTSNDDAVMFLHRAGPIGGPHDVAGPPTLTETFVATLGAGEHVLEVAEFGNLGFGGSSHRACFDVSITR